MFGCLFASFCSCFFFLPKRHSFAQLNVPNASRWSVLIPKCVLSVACSFDLPDATKVCISCSGNHGHSGKKLEKT